MFNRIICYAVFFLSLLLGSVNAQEKAIGEAVGPGDASVCFTDFRIQYAIGKTERDIGQPNYCLYKIEKQTFLQLLSARPDAEFYMAGYVRAKVVFSPDEVYFIDNNGIVRFGDKKFSIGKMAFTNALKQIAQPAKPLKKKGCLPECVY